MSDYKEQCWKRYMENKKYERYEKEDLVDEIIEMQGEIERLKNINEEHRILNGELRRELQQKENIIKEVREYIEIIVKNTPSSTRKDYANMILIDYKKVLEILDKGVDKE